MTRTAAPTTDPTLEEALERIGDLAQRLWAVRGTHRPVRSRTLLGRVVVQCSGCGRPSPCPTLQAADAA